MDSVLAIFGSGLMGAVLLGLAIGLVILGLMFGIMKLAKRGKVKKVEKPIRETRETKETADTAVRPGSIVISGFTISPHEAKEGEIVIISFKVTNTGDTRSLHTAQLRINGAEIGKLNMDLAPGETEVATFAVSKTAAGEYKVEVDGFGGNFVIPPADLIVSAIDINPRRTKEGDQVSIMAEVTNTGGVTDTQEVEVKLKDKVLVSEKLSVAPGANQRVNITLTNLEPGTHEVRIGDFVDTFAVEMLLKDFES